MKKTLLFILFICFTTTTVWAKEGLNVGERAPNIIGRTTKGSIFQLSKIKDKVKVVNFFWVFCVPCKKEMPELADFEKEYSNVVFVSVHTDAKDEDKIDGFLKALPSYPSNIVSSDRMIMGKYKFKGLPHTVVLDGNNKVLLVMEGYKEENMLALKDLLGKL